jgi:hypothetical protein
MTELTATTAVAQYLEASEIMKRAEQALLPLAKRQAELTLNVLSLLGLSDTYDYRELKYYDWIEFSAASDTVHCELWRRGSCGDPDSVQTDFDLDPLLIAGDEAGFEAKVRAKYKQRADDAARRAEHQRTAEIERLEKKLKELKS